MKEKKKEKKIDYIVGSGNVFADLGFGNPEEELLKARLAALVNRGIEAKSWTQQQTAKVLGIKQPDVSDLTRGRLEHFSVERLLNFLSKLDHQVTITVSNKKDKLPPQEIVIAANRAEKTLVVR
jgi:predicted XRE-type DNA-binding protein